MADEEEDDNPQRASVVSYCKLDYPTLLESAQLRLHRLRANLRKGTEDRQGRTHFCSIALADADIGSGLGSRSSGSGDLHVSAPAPSPGPRWGVWEQVRSVVIIVLTASSCAHELKQ